MDLGRRDPASGARSRKMGEGGQFQKVRIGRGFLSNGAAGSVAGAPILGLDGIFRAAAAPIPRH